MALKTPDLQVIEEGTSLEYTGTLPNILKDASNDSFFGLYLSRNKAKTGKINCIFPSDSYPEKDFLVTSIKFNLAWKVSSNITELANNITISIDIVGQTYTLTDVASYSIRPVEVAYPSIWNAFHISITDPNILKTFSEDSLIRSAYFSIKISTEATNITTLADQYFYIDGSADIAAAELEIYTKSDIYRYSNRWQRLLQAYRYDGNNWQEIPDWPYDAAGDIEKILKPREHYYSYSIKYDVNGGVTPDQLSYVYSSTTASFEVTLPNISIARSGYAFTGWNTAADGTGQAFNKDSQIELSSEVILYAQWVKMYTITWTKTAEVNWAAATLYTDLTEHTGPVSGNPPYLNCRVSPPADLSINYSALSFGSKFSKESGRKTNSFTIPFIGTKITWTTSTVYADSIEQQISVPVGTKLIFTLNNRYKNGGTVGAIYAGNTTSSAILWGPGQSKEIGNYEYTVDHDINIRANWRTAGEYIPGFEEFVNFIPGLSASDDRDSWWDVHIY